MLLVGIQAAADALSRKRDTQLDNALGTAIETASCLVAALIGTPSFESFDRADTFRLPAPRPHGDGTYYYLLWLTQPFLTEDAISVVAYPSLEAGAVETPITSGVQVDRTLGLVSLLDLTDLGNGGWLRVAYRTGFTTIPEAEFDVAQEVPAPLRNSALSGARILLADNPRYSGDRPTGGPILKQLNSAMLLTLASVRRLPSSRYVFPEYTTETAL